ncbi:DUF4097 family beta strand repeat-containing protein [Pseudoxanthomonas putridarboris]|uniref:DUF4097 family beta strand repeat-containing protein n=1 Tax=Pseudoxanthomonas putridarboris TaxID=752605 RepID=A0ABU9J156_9GAMM
MRNIFTASSLLAALALAAPLAAQAQEPHCKHSAPRQLSLDLAGVKAVVFDIGPNDLKVEATPGASAAVSGKACASAPERLDRLKLTQERVGDKLVVRAYREDKLLGFSFGQNYAYQTLSATLPDNLPVQLKVGSGDASVNGAAVLSADVGSGDVAARRIQGLAAVSVGSGDIELHDVGKLHVISIGSGKVEAHAVRGAVTVGSIGSGDFDLTGAAGDVEIGSIGSGDADVRGVKGGVSIRSIGSGDANVRDVQGNVSVGSIGSGDIEAHNVAGGLTVRSVGSGSIRHNDVRGPIDTPKKR